MLLCGVTVAKAGAGRTQAERRVSIYLGGVARGRGATPSGPRLSFAVRTRTSLEAERRAVRTRRFPEDGEWAIDGGGSKVHPRAGREAEAPRSADRVS